MKLCKDCKEFYLTKPFMGNCRIHPWKEDKSTQETVAEQCKDFVGRNIDWMPTRFTAAVSPWEA